MDIAKQIIDQRIYKIIADNPELFFHEDIGGWMLPPSLTHLATPLFGQVLFIPPLI